MSPRMHAILSPLVCIEAAKERSGPAPTPLSLLAYLPAGELGCSSPGGGGKEPSRLKVISCDCRGGGRGSLGGQGASWGARLPLHSSPDAPPA